MGGTVGAGAGNKLMASMTAIHARVVGNTKRVPKNTFDTSSSLPTPYRVVKANADEEIGNVAIKTAPRAAAPSRPTANAQPTIKSGTRISLTTMYAAARQTPMANGLHRTRKMPVANRATGSVHAASELKNRLMKPAPGAYEQLGWAGGAPA